jgi:hypothetical protein
MAEAGQLKRKTHKAMGLGFLAKRPNVTHKRLAGGKSA